jgi:predicted  nucleic acid-binding Zn-ribbon protein
MNELQDLKEKHRKLEIRLKEIEDKLRKPLKKDPDANAIEERDREVLNRVYQIEKDNLARIDAKIGKHLI